MQKLITVPDNLIGIIKGYSTSQGWSFSRAYNYCAYLGLCKLKDMKLITELPDYNVDKPHRKSKARGELEFDTL